MRRIDLSDYTVPLRNDQGVAKFTESKCACNLDLKKAEPTNVKVKDPEHITGNCPSCDKVHNVVIPDYIDVPYFIRDSLVEITLSRHLQLAGRELLERDALAQKILKCEDGSILLEEEEWAKLVTSAETVKGLGRPDVILIRRILEAPEIEVEEKK